jgi:hypothetical protein
MPEHQPAYLLLRLDGEAVIEVQCPFTRFGLLAFGVKDGFVKFSLS